MSYNANLIFYITIPVYVWVCTSYSYSSIIRFTIPWVNHFHSGKGKYYQIFIISFKKSSVKLVHSYYFWPKPLIITLIILLLVAIMMVTKYFVFMIVSRPNYNLLIQNIVNNFKCTITYGQINILSLSLLLDHADISQIAYSC